MSQASQQWETFSAELYRDGSWRDIYVLGTELQDWVATARFLTDRGYDLAFQGGWKGTNFPRDIGQLFASDAQSESTTLSVDVAGIQLNSHFFEHSSIEFDVDPAEVDDPPKLDAIFDLMQGLANALDKDVILTPENQPEIVIFRCVPGKDRVEHVPFGG